MTEERQMATALNGGENESSRRYLRVLMRWMPIGLEYFQDWPERARCGHFLGGVLWYGQDTAMPALACAVAAGSPEYDAAITGRSAEELREVALKSLRYLCFTHDTGPEECVRPVDPWGREVLSGTKWGERGRGFFPESQCGTTIGILAILSELIADRVADEERDMLRAIARDYLERFGRMAPRSGVYSNTQTEENAWTAVGLAASLVLLPDLAEREELLKNARMWMFRTVTRPQDRQDETPFSDGKTVGAWCGPAFTTHPDGTAENHGFVHPNYMGSAIGLSCFVMCLHKLFGLDVPAECLWRRKEQYAVLKPWCDSTGVPQAVQGMDWPYFNYGTWSLIHAAARKWLGDPDAGRLEEQALSVLEHVTERHAGRLVPDNVSAACHNQQDPAVLGERKIASVAYAYLVHRLGPHDPNISGRESMETRLRGVYVYPQGGAVVHRHARGVNSFSWRNRVMALPCTREGIKLIGPGAGCVAELEVRDRVRTSRQVALRVRETHDRACVLLVEHLYEESLRRDLMFASLPDGRCALMERMTAMSAVTVERVQQGGLLIVNDGYFAEHDDLRGHRRVFWQNGQQDFMGYAAADEENVEQRLPSTPWVNVDDRFGILFQGTGRTCYVNQRRFKPWRAVEDLLVLSLQDNPHTYEAGERVAQMFMVWCPEQRHQATAAGRLKVLEYDGVLGVETESVLCAANMTQETAELPSRVKIGAGGTAPLSWNTALTCEHPMEVGVRLGPLEPVIVETDSE